MTMMSNRAYTVATGEKTAAYRGYPVAEWDLSAREGASRHTANVRTLNISTTPVGASRATRSGGDETDEILFESRREKRESLLVGIGLGIALIVGSAIGGVFSPEQSGYSTPTEAEFAFYTEQ
ncbi:hypothetical protein [Corynebacterium sp. p3-SID1056]|uniref:hypothetical protein n=1 Tax=Corynebacterium sp. p3-SID1056 TaxID=2916092 RepID=UPI0021A2B453|nr:hypothetical protein [Corynebacterium sp. p3-SID1056]MCT2337751.1 hypothetical protein [Corynebacterium sp. p3-SID1056]